MSCPHLHPQPLAAREPRRAATRARHLCRGRGGRGCRCHIAARPVVASVRVEGDRIVIEPQKRRGRIGLAARLARCDLAIPAGEDERAWLDSPRVGREEL